MDTFLKKSKKSVVVNLTIIYTIVMIVVLLAIIFSLRYFVERISVRSYAVILKQQIEKISQPFPVKEWGNDEKYECIKGFGKVKK